MQTPAAVYHAPADADQQLRQLMTQADKVPALERQVDLLLQVIAQLEKHTGCGCGMCVARIELANEVRLAQ